MTTAPAFFSAVVDGDQEVLLPEQVSSSGWSGSQLRGMAVTGALARAIERHATAEGITDLSPARFTVDLFRPALMVPSTVRTTTVRRGRRLCLVDASFEQDGATVTRATTLYLRADGTPPGTVWSPPRNPTPPPADMTPESSEQRLYYADRSGWGPVSAADHEAVRRQTWHLPMPLVVGEVLTPFQMVGCIADVGNVVTNWGSEGLRFINADVTLALARLPVDLAFGLSTIDRVEADGISIGTTVVFDRQGVFGTTTVLAIANDKRPVDPRSGTRLSG